ncbi:MAG: patatin-like phospholipase family protein [Gammaproteobacteria bacterium]|nr:patatin-like phospholipase family protein [Gammaproteobacteria bacterium]MBU1414259.1 patatin-like phospholipase family protein [Gammaproteobacteria bacterium]
MLRLLLIPALLLVSATALARPTIGLVLGGGGARGAAHIGVLEVLQEMRIPIDCVAGTSMGALVAGAYAAGIQPAEMRAELGKANWNDMFIDNPDYSEMDYRNKEMSRRFLPGSETGVGVEKGVQYQGGVVTGQKIKLFFNQLVHADQGERNIESLPIPLSIIATDIGSGNRVVFRNGNLTRAMRASMSVPGLLAPVDDGKRKLVDGGLVDNLPIEEARNRCHPDVIIAVNVGSPLLKPEEIGSMLSVSAQMVNILTEQNVTRSLTHLRDGDILIKPDLTGITATDFQLNGLAADRGHQATQALREQLQRLSVDNNEYFLWWQNIMPAHLPPPKIDEIAVTGLKRVNPDALARHIEQRPGEPMDTERLNRDLLRAYADGYYESIDYEMLSLNDRHILRILPIEKPWGPDYLRLAVHLESTLSNVSNYGLRAGYHSTWLNRLGGQLLVTGEIGSTDAIGLNWYQPLDDRQRMFIEPTASSRRWETSVYERDVKVAQFRASESRAGLLAGLNFGAFGQFRAGWETQRHHTERDIGLPGMPMIDKQYGGWRAALDLDQTDRLYSPTRGWAAHVGYFDSSKAGYSRLEATAQAAGSLGKYVLAGNLRYLGSPRGQLPYYDAGSLGGFLKLSGLAPGQIIGDDIRYAGIRAERIIGRLPLGLRGDMRFGVALETGKVGYRYTEPTYEGWLKSGAIYVGGETPLGMLYLGFGRTSSGSSNVYLVIGAP